MTVLLSQNFFDEEETYRYTHSGLIHLLYSLVFLLLFSPLGKRRKRSNSRCVLVCVRAQNAWSAVLSYRKSRGWTPLGSFAGEVEHDSASSRCSLFLFSFVLVLPQSGLFSLVKPGGASYPDETGKTWNSWLINLSKCGTCANFTCEYVSASYDDVIVRAPLPAAFGLVRNNQHSMGRWNPRALEPGCCLKRN